MDLLNVKTIKVSGSETWDNSYEFSQLVEEAFPDVDPSSFASAVTYHDNPLADSLIIDIVMEQEGQNDCEDWIWVVTVADGRRWRLSGWCDFTGWDCQSSASWRPLDPLPPCDIKKVVGGLRQIRREMKEMKALGSSQ